MKNKWIMHPYLPHLLSDIAAAHREETIDPINTNDDEDFILEKYFEQIERWVTGEEPPHTFSYYCDLQYINFPPPQQLDNSDLKMICKAFEKMMHTWNLRIALPENLPVPMAYTLIVDILNKKINIPVLGMITFDFCTGYAPECDLKSYCPCLKFWNEIEEDPFGQEDENYDS